MKTSPRIHVRFIEKAGKLSEIQVSEGLNSDKHERLVLEAFGLKRAWLVATVLAGLGVHLIDEQKLIPNYIAWENKSLKRHIKDLEDDFESLAKKLLPNWKRSQLHATVQWFAQRHEAWVEAGLGVFELGRVHEIEKAVGKLYFQQFTDCPPYAQVLLQGMELPAMRHPEYHLGSDLALLFNLLLDSESMLATHDVKHGPPCSEHSQSLARSVILTCFNLLESFVSGLAMAYQMENPDASESTKKKLQDKSLPLRKRLIEYPALIAGRDGLIDGSQPPFKPLMDECKRRRDSFVHCEPGPKPTSWGYVKEQEFHDANLKNASQTVDFTLATISHIWKAIHGQEKPTWLPSRDSSGRFERVTVTLAILGITLPARNTPHK
jgi:hypothetical protein